MRKMIKIKETSIEALHTHRIKEESIFVAIEATEKDLEEYIARSSHFAKFYKQKLEEGKQILLIPPRIKNKREVLKQYGRFLQVRKNKRKNNSHEIIRFVKPSITPS